jgi:hypothetical protein
MDTAVVGVLPGYTAVCYTSVPLEVLNLVPGAWCTTRVSVLEYYPGIVRHAKFSMCTRVHCGEHHGEHHGEHAVPRRARIDHTKFSM